MAEGARLESVYTATYRGFESLPHRHYLLREPERKFRLFYRFQRAPAREGENPRRVRQHSVLYGRRPPAGRAATQHVYPSLTAIIY